MDLAVTRHAQANTQQRAASLETFEDITELLAGPMMFISRIYWFDSK